MEQVLENFYTQDEIERIWTEIKFLDSNTFGWIYPTVGRNATDKNENLLLQGARQLDYGMFGYHNENVLKKSNLYSLGQKIYDHAEFLSEKHDVYSNVLDIVYHTAFLNYYYKDNSVYNLHRDSSMYTLLSYFYEEPRNFNGGKFVVEDREYEISNGFTIILPGWMKHGTTPMKIIDKSRTKSGRYSIAHFFWSMHPKHFDKDYQYAIKL